MVKSVHLLIVGNFQLLVLYLHPFSLPLVPPFILFQVLLLLPSLLCSHLSFTLFLLICFSLHSRVVSPLLECSIPVLPSAYVLYGFLIAALLQIIAPASLHHPPPACQLLTLFLVFIIFLHHYILLGIVGPSHSVPSPHVCVFSCNKPYVLFLGRLAYDWW